MTLYLLILGIKKLRHLKAWLLGPSTPDWFNGCVQILSALWTPLHHLIPLELIPSLLAIGINPRHYFQRLPVILNKKSFMFKAPIPLLVDGIVALAWLICFVFPRLNLGIKERGVQLMLLAAALLSPVIIYVTLFLCGGCMVVFRLFLPDRYIERLINELRVALCRRRYSRLNFASYVRGMCALSVFLFLTFPIVVAGFWFSDRELSSLFSGYELPTRIEELWFLPVAALGCSLLLAPYTELIRSVTVIPYLEAIDLDVLSLNEVLATRSDRPAYAVCKSFRIRWSQIRSQMLKEELNALKLGEQSVEFYRISRAIAYLRFSSSDVAAISNVLGQSAEGQVLTRISLEISEVQKGNGLSRFWTPPSLVFDEVLALIDDFDADSAQQATTSLTAAGASQRAMTSSFIQRFISDRYEVTS